MLLKNYRRFFAVVNHTLVCTVAGTLTFGVLSLTVMTSGLCSTSDRIHRVVTSQNLWSRYDRHFVGITRYNALS